MKDTRKNRPGHSPHQIFDWPNKLRKSLKMAAASQERDYRDVIIEACERWLERFKKGGK